MKLIASLAIFLTLCVMGLGGCQTTATESMSQPTPKRAARHYQPKYKEGDCVVFDQTKISMRSDGTPMKILMINDSVYTVIIIHEKVEGEVFFTAVAQKFDNHTKISKCSGELKRW